MQRTIESGGWLAGAGTGLAAIGREALKCLSRGWKEGETYKELFRGTQGARFCLSLFSTLTKLAQLASPGARETRSLLWILTARHNREEKHSSLSLKEEGEEQNV